ncbi:MAG: 4Fe-4S dicluster domain-containing protein [Flavobacteriales bacterium]|nr:4Fe-4S dicluster domain-containing protein [Flavobacteriales bacterium]
MALIIFYTIALLLFSLFSYFAWISYIENETRAANKSLILAIITPLPFIALAILPNQYHNSIVYLIIGAPLLLTIISFFLNKKLAFENEISQTRIDERDTMFSRLEITHSEEKAKEYYNYKPEKLVLDKIWQEKPGLMNKGTTMYNPVTFAAADASFFTIEELRKSVSPEVKEEKQILNTEEITNFVKKWTKKLGAIEVGICELKDHHLYSHRGRGDKYGKEVNNDHKYAIAITVEMDKDYLATGPASPTVMESAQQYLNVGAIAVQLSKFITNLGYNSRAHIDGNYEVICPLVARDSGLGEIGRMGLLITKTHGPRVRIAVVTTNLELIASDRNYDSSVHDFCNICKKCAVVCPSKAISTKPKKLIEGINRWQINQEKCFTYWCKVGTDCGRCVSVCPYSHTNIFPHNIIRSGIRNSWAFRRVALVMDDFFYGKKPSPRKIDLWLNFSAKKLKSNR